MIEGILAIVSVVLMWLWSRADSQRKDAEIKVRSLQGRVETYEAIERIKTSEEAAEVVNDAWK